MGLTRGELAEWVRASCEAQGVAVFVTDAGVVARVSALLGGGTEARGVVGNRGVMLDVFSRRSLAGRGQCRAAR
jgi:hypothetical protein